MRGRALGDTMGTATAGMLEALDPSSWVSALANSPLFTSVATGTLLSVSPTLWTPPVTNTPAAPFALDYTNFDSTFGTELMGPQANQYLAPILKAGPVVPPDNLIISNDPNAAVNYVLSNSWQPFTAALNQGMSNAAASVGTDMPNITGASILTIAAIGLAALIIMKDFL